MFQKNPQFGELQQYIVKVYYSVLYCMGRLLYK
jgi:hypothetical protein